MGTVTTVQYSGLDWITATANTELSGYRLACLAESIVDLHAAEGYKRRPWAKWGYVGESARFVSFGRKEGSTCLVLSGEAADAWFDHVADLADHVSRVDLCVTVKTEPPMEGVARRHYGELVNARQSNGHLPTGSIIESTDGGSTCYLGRRISDRFLRVYDKSREVGEEAEPGLWRYELELKNASAVDAVRWLANSPDRPDRCRATLHRYCTSRGIHPIYPYHGESLQLRSSRPYTDLEGKLNWLAKTVGKSAQEAANSIGWEGLLNILGVDRLGLNGNYESGGDPHGHHSYESYPDKED